MKGSNIELSDILRAKKICDGDSMQRKKMLHDMSSNIMFRARKFSGKQKSNDTSYNYQHNNHTINVTDSVSDTYLWLSKYLFKKSCKFEGLNKSSLNTYLNSTLNSHFTYNDFKKSKMGGLSIPVCIKTLTKEHQITFRSLKHKYPIEQIMTQLKKNHFETELIIMEVRDSLTDAGLIDLIDEPIIGEIGGDNKEGEKPREYDIEDANEISIPDKSDALDYQHILSDCYSKLEKEDKRLLRMYWDSQISAKSIYEDYFKNKDKLLSFKNIDIKKEIDVTLNIKRIIKIFDELLMNEYSELYNQENFDIKRIQKMLKVFIQEFYKQSDDNIRNIYNLS